MVFLCKNAPDDVAGHCTIAAAPLVSVLRARVQTRPGGQTSGGAGRDCSTCRAVCDSCKRCTHWCTLCTLCTHWSTPAKLLSRKVLLHALAASPAASQTRKNCNIFHFEIIFLINLWLVLNIDQFTIFSRMRRLKSLQRASLLVIVTRGSQFGVTTTFGVFLLRGLPPWPSKTGPRNAASLDQNRGRAFCRLTAVDGATCKNF